MSADGGCISLIGTLDGYSMSLPGIPSFIGRATVQGIGVGHRRALDDLVRAVDALGLKPENTQANTCMLPIARLICSQEAAYEPIV
ncbi:MAG TPA: hypothetical protein VFE81_06905 [Paraburkholderia sp.]|nr:hypothetical protein [Paraburkholderia sp.]HZZ02630.1 hypothetical protein [Paraburkholderia sp.]